MKYKCPECGNLKYEQSTRANIYRSRPVVEICEDCVNAKEKRNLDLAHQIEVQKLIDEFNQKNLQINLLAKVKKKLTYIKCKDDYRVHRHKRRALLNNSSGTHGKKYIRYLLEKQKNKCIACLIDISKLYHVDHIYPLSKGGGNGEDNIQLLCQSCNSKKNAQDPIFFLQKYNLMTYCEI